MIDIGAMKNRVALENPTTVNDPDGGTVDTWAALDPSPVWAAIEPATARNLERLVAHTIEAKLSHVVTLRFHPQVTTKTRLTYNGRILQVRGLQNVREQDVELVLACEEVVA